MDIRTIFAFLFIIQIFLSIVLTVLWHSHKKNECFYYYALSTAIISTTYFLFVLRNVISDFITITIANVLCMMACYYRMESYSSFFKTNIRKYNLTSLITFSVMAVFFCHIYDSAVMRVVILSTYIGCISVYIGMLFKNNVITENKPLYYIGVIINFWFAIITIARVISWIMIPEIRSLLSPSAINIFYLMSLLINDIGGTIVFTLINNERLSRELKYAINTKDRFFSIIAHDLMGPLGNITSMMELFLDEKYSFKDDEKKEILIQLKKKSQITYELLENLLKWARSQRNEIKYEPELFEIGDIINKNIEIFKDIAAQKKIELIYNAQDHTAVLADKKMISTIIRNLISNAIKFSNMNGRIVISAEKSDNNTAAITIEDNGIGIEPQTLEKLFKIDENISTCGTNNEQGTGLGLILCKEFIEKNKGRIKVESELNKGSKFIIFLPSVPS